MSIHHLVRMVSLQDEEIHVLNRVVEEERRRAEALEVREREFERRG